MFRITVLVLALSVAGDSSMPLVGLAAQGGGATPAPSACSLLSRDLIAAHSPASKESLKLMLSVPPTEDKVGAGTACSFGGITMQVDPFAASNFENLFGKNTPVTNVGDKAYFRDNRGRFAELAVMSGGRMLTFQVNIPSGSTAAAVQPNVVALARAIIAKLK
jgi:hypothetical protein